MKFEIVPTEKAAILRETFIEQFIDQTSEHFQKHIAALIQYADGLYYDGYLWDCLKDNQAYQKECRMETAAEFLRNKGHVFVMWDLFSNERVHDHKRFSSEYPKDTVIRIQGGYLAQKVMAEWNAGFQCQGLWFPEDIYCFEESMTWYVIFTHEGWDSLTNPELDDDAYIRICFLGTQT